MCHLELSLDTPLEKKSARVSAREGECGCYSLYPPWRSPLFVCGSERLEQEGFSVQAPRGRWTTTLGLLNKCDYTC